MNDFIEDFTAEECQKYADIICNGLEASELETLETYADFWFGYVETNGRAVTFSDTCPLMLDVQAEYDGDDE